MRQYWAGTAGLYHGWLKNDEAVILEKWFETDRGKFQIRPYGIGDEQGVLSLWQAAFGKEMPEDLWRWKYLESPFKHKILLCLNEQREVVAFYGGIPYRANREGRTIEVVQLMDIMSHPDYRGAGLFVRTAKEFFRRFCDSQGSDFLYGFPGKYHYELGRRLIGYKGLPGGVSFLTARTADLAGKNRWFGGRFELISEIDSSFDNLWKVCLDYYPLSVIRDAKFVRWRFMDHPLKKYEVWGYRRYFGKKLQGYAVFSIEGQKARLIDMLTPSSIRLTSDFLARLGGLFGERGIEEVETWFPAHHFLFEAAVSAGFTSLPEPLGIISTVRVFDHSPNFEWMAKNIYYSMADGDLF